MAKRKTINHEIFGQLTHVVGDLWKRDLDLHMFGQLFTVDLTVDIDTSDGPENNQIIAYSTFAENTDSIIATAEQAIFDYYQSTCSEFRDRYGITDPNDEKVPVINSKQDLSILVEPEGVTFPYARPQPTFGILCKCTWEEERGLAVKFEDEEVSEVGFQDIVL